jgi:1-acyl-sn-glycerol-3-phosphate acyltransferase
MLTDRQTDLVAILVLLSCCAGLVAWYIIAWRRTTYTLVQYPFFLLYQFIRHMLWRARVNRPLPVTLEQGAVIVANHRSSMDPAFLHDDCPRVIHWMIAKEYWANPVMGAFFRLAECIPVGRGGIDTAATKAAIRYAQQGDLVGMFPEGRINATKAPLLPGRPGAVLVALKARVPIIPCFIHDAPYDGTATGVFTMPAKVRTMVGRPIDLSPYYGREREEGVLQEITLRVMREMACLGGYCDFKPTLAGRKWKPEI